MGRRDYRHREPKKTKKGAKKVLTTNILPPPMTVEVVRKERKERKERKVEEEEE